MLWCQFSVQSVIIYRQVETQLMFLLVTWDYYVLPWMSVKSIIPRSFSVTLLQNPVAMVIKNFLQKHSWKKSVPPLYDPAVLQQAFSFERHFLYDLYRQPSRNLISLLGSVSSKNKCRHFCGKPIVYTRQSSFGPWRDHTHSVECEILFSMHPIALCYQAAQIK